MGARSATREDPRRRTSAAPHPHSEQHRLRSRGFGVRLLDTVTNPGSSPITTQVWVGDLSTANAGGLDSNSVANLRHTSSGDQTLSTADRWLVTSDSKTPTNSSDL